jgi:hypothetical protein
MQQYTTSGQPGILGLADTDSMLLCLGGQSCLTSAAACIYEDVHAEAVNEHYAQSSYPFFADRILGLQDFTQGHQRRKWEILWLSRWDKSDWWQLWVLLFGGCAIVISILSLAFQIWQAFLAQQQLSLAAHGDGRSV